MHVFVGRGVVWYFGYWILFMIAWICIGRHMNMLVWAYACACLIVNITFWRIIRSGFICSAVWHYLMRNRGLLWRVGYVLKETGMNIRWLPVEISYRLKSILRSPYSVRLYYWWSQWSSGKWEGPLAWQSWLIISILIFSICWLKSRFHTI